MYTLRCLFLLFSLSAADILLHMILLVVDVSLLYYFYTQFVSGQCFLCVTVGLGFLCCFCLLNCCIICFTS